MRSLIGKKIKTIFVDKYTNGYIVFVFSPTNEYSVFSAVGDCCSESWIEDIHNHEFLIDATILDVGVKNIEVKDEDYKSPACVARFDQWNNSVLQIWGYSIKTDKGICDIELRNMSNGYYAGELWRLDGARLVSIKGASTTVGILENWECVSKNEFIPSQDTVYEVEELK